MGRGSGRGGSYPVRKQYWGRSTQGTSRRESQSDNHGRGRHAGEFSVGEVHKLVDRLPTAHDHKVSAQLYTLLTSKACHTFLEEYPEERERLQELLERSIAFFSRVQRVKLNETLAQFGIGVPDLLQGRRSAQGRSSSARVAADHRTDGGAGSAQRRVSYATERGEERPRGEKQHQHLAELRGRLTKRFMTRARGKETKGWARPGSGRGDVRTDSNTIEVNWTPPQSASGGKAGEGADSPGDGAAAKSSAGAAPRAHARAAEALPPAGRGRAAVTPAWMKSSSSGAGGPHPALPPPPGARSGGGGGGGRRSPLQRGSGKGMKRSVGATGGTLTKSSGGRSEKVRRVDEARHRGEWRGSDKGSSWQDGDRRDPRWGTPRRRDGNGQLELEAHSDRASKRSSRQDWGSWDNGRGRADDGWNRSTKRKTENKWRGGKWWGGTPRATSSWQDSYAGDQCDRETLVCATHSKQRCWTNLVQGDAGTWVCRAGFECIIHVGGSKASLEPPLVDQEEEEEEEEKADSVDEHMDDFLNRASGSRAGRGKGSDHAGAAEEPEHVGQEEEPECADQVEDPNDTGPVEETFETGHGEDNQSAAHAEDDRDGAQVEAEEDPHPDPQAEERQDVGQAAEPPEADGAEERQQSAQAEEEQYGAGGRAEENQYGGRAEQEQYGGHSQEADYASGQAQEGYGRGSGGGGGGWGSERREYNRSGKHYAGRNDKYYDYGSRGYYSGEKQHHSGWAEKPYHGGGKNDYSGRGGEHDYGGRAKEQEHGQRQRRDQHSSGRGAEQQGYGAGRAHHEPDYVSRQRRPERRDHRSREEAHGAERRDRHPPHGGASRSSGGGMAGGYHRGSNSAGGHDRRPSNAEGGGGGGGGRGGYDRRGGAASSAGGGHDRHGGAAAASGGGSDRHGSSANPAPTLPPPPPPPPAPAKEAAPASQGWQGQQGHQSHQSYQSHHGHHSQQGHQGYQSHHGQQGHQGYQGHQGQQGHQGYQGHQGHHGHQGQQGHSRRRSVVTPPRAPPAQAAMPPAVPMQHPISQMALAYSMGSCAPCPGFNMAMSAAKALHQVPLAPFTAPGPGVDPVRQHIEREIDQADI